MRIRLRLALIFCTLTLLSVGFRVLAQEEGDVLFEDHFEDSKDLPDWNWDADYHEFARVATDGDNRVLRMVGSSDGASLYSEGGADWENYALELRFQIVTVGERDSYDFVLVLRDDANHSASAGAIFASQSSEAVISTYYDDEYREFERIVYEFNTGEWYSARFAVQGEQLELSVNGVVVAQAQTDQQGDSGNIGLVAGANTVILFDDVRVTELAASEAVTLPFDDAVRSLVGDGSPSADDSQPAEGTVTAEVVVGTANLRSGPSADYPIIATAGRGAVFEVVAQSGEGDDVWYRVVGDDPNVETWVFSGTVQIEPENAAIPDVEEIQP